MKNPLKEAGSSYLTGHIHNYILVFNLTKKERAVRSLLTELIKLKLTFQSLEIAEQNF